MTKDNVLFIVIGLLAGFMIGFFFANSVNQGALVSSPGSTTTGLPSTGMPQGGGSLPEGHPAVPGSGGGGAIPEVQAAIDKAKQNPTDFDAQIKAAELYYQIQRYDGAVEFLKKATELRPDDYGALVQLGNAYFENEKYDDAEKTYSKALAKKPDDVNVRTDLGLTYVFRDNAEYDRAIQEFKKVLEKDPNHVQALQNLTVAYTKKSDATNASATLARLEAADAKNESIPRLKEEIQKMGTK
ncbi:MAG TPA: tetratricopeptide repeat protein [Pyrinomonadaceae bacterium]|nr:tetratricopeptide repeat protein [Pyrinomonadaceae bacterium]